MANIDFMLKPPGLVTAEIREKLVEAKRAYDINCAREEACQQANAEPNQYDLDWARKVQHSTVGQLDCSSNYTNQTNSTPTQTISITPPSTPAGVCPTCGRCPTCGHTPQPQWYWYNPYNPYSPWGQPNIPTVYPTW